MLLTFYFPNRNSGHLFQLLLKTPCPLPLTDLQHHGPCEARTHTHTHTHTRAHSHISLCVTHERAHTHTNTHTHTRTHSHISHSVQHTHTHISLCATHERAYTHTHTALCSSEQVSQSLTGFP